MNNRVITPNLQHISEDDSPVWRMSESERARSEELARETKKWLSVRSDRFTVRTLDRIFNYEITYSAPCGMIRVNFAMPYDFDGYDEAARDFATQILKMFSDRLWEKYKDLFEAGDHMCKRMFFHMIWKDDPK